MVIKTMETNQMIITAQCNCIPNQETYCEGMVTEDNKDKKKTQDIIAG